MFFLDRLVDLKKNRGLCPNFWLLCAYVVYLLLLLCCGALGCPDASKTKTPNSRKTFKKFKCLGDVLDSVTPITIFNIDVPSFGRLYNLAEILI